MRKVPPVIRAVLVQFALLAFLAVPNAVTVLFGTTVILKTVPVDPRDFFRGQYVALTFAASRAPYEREPASEVPRVGQTVYVPLRETRDGTWEAGAARLERPRTGVFLRGEVQERSGAHVRVRYGIEQYFASETEARRYEALAGSGLQAVVRVRRDGTARLQKLAMPAGGARP